jgi:hypothetical protein
VGAGARGRRRPGGGRAGRRGRRGGRGRAAAAAYAAAGRRDAAYAALRAAVAAAPHEAGLTARTFSNKKLKGSTKQLK